MIIGQGIRLRAIEREDLPRFVTWMNDPEVRQGLNLIYPLSMAQEERWFEQMLQRHPAEQVLGIEVEIGGVWTLIGTCGLHNVDWVNRQAELGISIGDKAFWNRGYGRRAVRLLLRHAFNTLNLNRIYLRVYETNPRAIRAYEHAGFTLEGRLRQARFQNGHYVDELIMSILRSEWHDAED